MSNTQLVNEHENLDTALALQMSMEEGPVWHQQEKAKEEEKEEFCSAQVVKQEKEEAERHATVKREAKHGAEPQTTVESEEDVVIGDHSGPDEDLELVFADDSYPEVALALHAMKDEARSPRHLASLQQQDLEIDQIVACSKFAELHLQRVEVSNEGPVVFHKVNEGPVYVVRCGKLHTTSFLSRINSTRMCWLMTCLIGACTGAAAPSCTKLNLRSPSAALSFVKMLSAEKLKQPSNSPTLNA